MSRISSRFVFRDSTYKPVSDLLMMNRLDSVDLDNIHTVSEIKKLRLAWVGVFRRSLTVSWTVKAPIAGCRWPWVYCCPFDYERNIPKCPGRTLKAALPRKKNVRK